MEMLARAFYHNLVRISSGWCCWPRRMARSFDLDNVAAHVDGVAPARMPQPGPLLRGAELERCQPRCLSVGSRPAGGQRGAGAGMARIWATCIQAAGALLRPSPSGRPGSRITGDDLTPYTGELAKHHAQRRPGCCARLLAGAAHRRATSGYLRDETVGEPLTAGPHRGCRRMTNYELRRTQAS